MPKRPHDESARELPQKRARPTLAPDRLSALSDELALHVLSFLPIRSLITCQRVSRRFYILASDSEIWKRKYYSRWILPRARRVRQLTQLDAAIEPIGYSSKVVKWLEHGRSWREGREIDWMKEYRLQHNWSKGSCRVRELEVAQPPIPPVLVNLHNGVVFTVDARNGLRAWSMKDTEVMLASQSFDGFPSVAPTAVAISSNESSSKDQTVAVGFEDGSFEIYTLDYDTKRFKRRLSKSKHEDGEITALASCPGYLLVLFQNKKLSLYRLASDSSLRLIDSLHASNIRAPLTLSVRIVGSGVIASIAYSFPRIGCGWCIGLQEVRWDEDGQNLGSHLATPLDSQALSSPIGLGVTMRRSENPVSALQRQQSSFPYPSYTQPPTALSYSHPYLLTAHSDNTLTTYLVVSTAEKLTISPPRRLWGHTSSISGVQVGGRGKAVSVSSRGDDIRVWELEGMVPSPLIAKAPRLRERSIQLSPERMKSQSAPIGSKNAPNVLLEFGASPRLTQKDTSSELTKMTGLVGFDDEQVVVLREQDLGTQLLDCYDFR
ncbi:hypothetical protein D8B26_000824 [Coccidioides posadasii str. Silveira]|uniref:Probable E3 ubiquitin ligase complex SCF subunit sconB n=1 Tax=Coccidioides posadasii (strain RMSCC 757 / Silveira) TaxID=443226 RepID=E9CRX9_COCPS|nr:conserved hypothetical protein [Coccidioides posadasii str. Silveira]QVM06111.1 hypothetical protein D8B26_000824 [Coccidioides posadasii str. Silveira]